MSQSNKCTVIGLDDYGLSLRTLTQLGTTPVQVKVWVARMDERRLFKLPPAERKRRMDAWRRDKVREIMAAWPCERPARIGATQSPGGVQGSLPARCVRLLAKLPIETIFITEIKGRRKQPRAQEPRFYGVLARYAIQIEGQTSGMQTYEHRLVLVWAKSETEAQRKATREAKSYEHVYLNPHGERVRWHLEEILEIYDTMATEIDPDGTEVYSRLRERRMKPDHEWHPNHVS